MWRVTWRNLFARKLRLLLSAFAIVLGVAFVAGTLIFTNAMGGAFDNIIEGSTADVEVAYKGANDFDSGQDNRTFPASVVTGPRGAARGRVGQPAEHAADRLRDRQGRQGHRRQRPARPGHQPDRRQVADRQADPDASTDGAYPTGPDQIALDVDTAEKGGFEIGDEVKLATPGRPPRHEGQDHRAGRVRVGWPERRHHDGLRQPVHAGAVLRRPRRLQHGLAQRGPGRLPDRARQGGAEGAARRAWSRGPATPTSRRTRRASTRSSASCRPSCWSSRRIALVRRHLPDHQHLLDPGRPAQPRARPAARHGRLAQAGQRVGAPRGDRRGAASGRRSGWASATCSRSACAGCSAQFGLDLSRADVPDDLAGGAVVLRRSGSASRRSRRCSRPAAPRGSRRSRPCATTWRCPSRPLRRRVLIGTVLVRGGRRARWPSGLDG